MNGTRLGHFDVLEQLGEGGMGVVYKARDTHLDRFVAIKVLRAERMGDAERKRRFVQEAKAASALNHPNIITVHDISREGDVDYMVMELVSGKGLGQLIAGRPMPLREILQLAAQIADALAAAHGAGIIHRDLKPANLMVNDRGFVKVLDFGLAKLREPTALGPEAATRTALAEAGPATEEGTILGTVAYMSPEQAEGRAVDARSDIFSIGVVLYEMVTGRRPFRGETRLSTLSAILKEDPKPVSDLRPEVLPELERIIARCLRKDPARRFQHMDDLKVALEEAKEESDSVKSATPRPVASRFGWRWPAAAALAAVLVMAGILYWKKQTPQQTGGEPVLRRLTADSGLTTQPALSPDGKLVAYASDRAGDGGLDIYVQQLAGGEPHRLTTDAADDSEPSFSPDSSRIVFSSEREGGGIFVVSTFGGAERKIAGRGYRPRFSPDGARIAYWAGDRSFSPAYGFGEVWLASADGGKVEKLATGLASAGLPVWSPDGRSLLVEGRLPRSNFDEAQDWFVIPLDGKPAVRTGAAAILRANKLLVSTVTSGDYVRPVPHDWTAGGILFSAPLGDSVNVWESPIEADFRMTTKPRRLTSGTGMEGNSSLAYAGGNRLLVFSSMTANTDIWGLPFSPDQPSGALQLRRITDNVAEDIRPSISADGRLITFNSNRSGNWDAWIRDLTSGKETQITSSPANEENPRISPDGTRISYRIVTNNQQTGFVIPATGGLARQFVQGCNLFPWAQDSRQMLCAVQGLLLVDVDSGQKRRLLDQDAGGPAPRLSWDGEWVVYYQRQRGTLGRTRIVAAPVSATRTAGAKDEIGVTKGDFDDKLPEFSPNGKLIYFISNRDTFECLWAVRFDAAASKPVGDPFPVHHFHSARRSPGFVRGGQRAISIARDKIVFTMQERTGNIWLSESPAP
ncbi:MAG: serine/threonine-protein kinase [Acidobacteriia bacterium]|nr:serine/threonine-protein kinase [Terriglobia bacterium]